MDYPKTPKFRADKAQGRNPSAQAYATARSDDDPMQKIVSLNPIKDMMKETIRAKHAMKTD